MNDLKSDIMILRHKLKTVFQHVHGIAGFSINDDYIKIFIFSDCSYVFPELFEKYKVILVYLDEYEFHKNK